MIYFPYHYWSLFITIFIWQLELLLCVLAQPRPLSAARVGWLWPRGGPQNIGKNTLEKATFLPLRAHWSSIFWLFSLLRLGRGSGRERKRERERKGCFCKRLFFLLLAPGSALEKIAANVNPEGKPWTGPSHGPVCGKNCSLIRVK